MDIVLEGIYVSLLAPGDGGNTLVMDSVAFDKFWATVAPFRVPGNQSFTPPNYPTFFTMTQPKYLSTVPRDNIYRQFLSLWFITVHPCPHPAFVCASIAVTNERAVDVRRNPLLRLRLPVLPLHL